MPRVLAVPGEGSPLSSRRQTDRLYFPGMRLTKDIVLTPVFSGSQESLTGSSLYAYWSSSGEVKFMDAKDTENALSSVPSSMSLMKRRLMPGPPSAEPAGNVFPLISAVMK